MAVNVCPVCNGRGTVQTGFYEGGPVNKTAERERCRSCGGTGVIITPEPGFYTYPAWRPEPYLPRYCPSTNEPPNPCERWEFFC